MKLIEAMVLAKLAKSKTDAKSLINQNAVELNEKKIVSIDEEAEPGIIRVGRKYLKIGLFANCQTHCDNGGNISLEISPIQTNPDEKTIIEIVSYCLMKGVLFMDSKGYIKTNLDIEEKNLQNHFSFLLQRKLIIPFINQRRGLIELDLAINQYLNPIKEVENYVILKNQIISEIKKIKNKNFFLEKIVCPKCAAKELSCAYNQNELYPEEKFNVNGICRNCDFKFNELA